MSTMEYMISKLVSGRFLLTIIVGYTFAYLSCKQLIPAQSSLTIIAMVITFYFTKNRDAGDAALEASITAGNKNKEKNKCESKNVDTENKENKENK